MALFCVATGFTPYEYFSLTMEQRDAIIQVLNRRK